MDADDDRLLEKPIIIIGPPRTGTSALLSVLACHRRLAGIAEPRITWRFGNDGRSDLLRPEHARPEVREHVRRTFAAEVRAQGAARLVEKTPSNALRPAFVERIFPDCLFLNILRDPYEAVLSLRDSWEKRASGVRGFRRRRWTRRLAELELRRAPRYGLELLRRAAPSVLGGWVGRPEWGPRLPGMQQMLRELDLLEVCCLQWRLCAELSCHHGRALPASRYLELRLEDFDGGVLDRVLAFCELEDDPAVRARFDAYFDRKQAGGRRHAASPADLETIRAWLAPAMAWLGYRP